MSFSPTSFSGKSFHLIPNPGERIIANISGDNQSLNISGEVKEAEYKEISNQPPQFNLIINNAIFNNPSFNQNIELKSIFQTYTIENILTITNQQNISNEIKATLQSKVKDFEDECKKPVPDQSKLKSIVDSVIPIAKDVGILLLKHAIDKGIILLFS